MEEYFDKWLEELICAGEDKLAVDGIKSLAINALMVASHICTHRINNLQDALKFTKSALELDPTNPKLNNSLAFIYLKLHDLPKALEYSEKTIDSGLIDCYVNHGLILEACKDYENAKKVIRKAVELSPNNTSLHHKLYELCCSLKQYEEALYEDQWKQILSTGKPFISRFHDIWDGKASLEGKVVLVFNDHGLGDIIQYSRYIEHIQTAGGYTILEVDECQTDIFDNLKGLYGVINRKDSLDPTPPSVNYDYAISAVALPYYFGLSLNDIKTDPYLSIPQNDNNPGVKIIKECGKKKVGIVWAGNKWHGADKYRSCALRHFKALSDLDNVQLFGLQKGDMIRSYPDDTQTLKEGGDLEIVNLLKDSENINYIDLSSHLSDFKSTAEILLALDLLITVDSSVGHLAGAIGVPTWVLLADGIYDWRWDFKLYNNHKIFKQKTLGDYESLIADIAKELVESI